MTSRSATLLLCWITVAIAWSSAAYSTMTGSFGLADAALIVVGGTGAAGAVFARRRISDVDQELAAEREAIKVERQELSERRAELDKFLETTKEQLTDRARPNRVAFIRPVEGNPPHRAPLLIGDIRVRHVAESTADTRS